MKNEKLSSTNIKRKSLFVFFAIIVFWALSSLEFLVFDKPGEFGDAFGAVNALFSGLAFGGAIFAILIQTADLQKKDTEIQDQKFLLDRQMGIMKRQTFENTFFQMIKIHHEIVNSVDIHGEWHGQQQIKKGTDCFEEFYRKFKRKYEHCVNQNQGDLNLNQKINCAYLEFFQEAQSDVGRYFRYLYNIIKFVDNSEFLEHESDRVMYVNLVRAQLSIFEQLLLFYNCLSEKGDKHFKPFVEKYALLESLESKDLCGRDRDYNLYPLSAYGE